MFSIRCGMITAEPEYPTFLAAEKAARKRLVRTGHPVTIRCQEVPLWHSMEVARVSRDAFDRVWTDLTPYSAPLI